MTVPPDLDGAERPDEPRALGPTRVQRVRAGPHLARTDRPPLG
jgi:hypothetical protein